MHDIVQSKNIAEIMRELMELRGSDRESGVAVINCFADMLETLPYSFRQSIDIPSHSYHPNTGGFEHRIWNPREQRMTLLGTVTDHKRFARFVENCQETMAFNCGLYMQHAEIHLRADEHFQAEFEMITYPQTLAGDIVVKLLTPLHNIIHEVYERLRELARRQWNLTDPMEKALLHYTEALVMFYDAVLNHGYAGFSPNGAQQEQSGHDAPHIGRDGRFLR